MVTYYLLASRCSKKLTPDLTPTSVTDGSRWKLQPLSRNHPSLFQALLSKSYYLFQNLPNLHKMDLDSNQLESSDLPDYVFSGIGSSLTWLDLWNNDLTVIRTNMFKGNWRPTHARLHTISWSNHNKGMNLLSPTWQTTWILRVLCEFWIENSRNSREFREFCLVG